jgi:hypothetical protein
MGNNKKMGMLARYDKIATNNNMGVKKETFKTPKAPC